MLDIPALFLHSAVEAWVDIIYIFLVKLFFCQTQPLASTGRVEWRSGAANKSADRYNILFYGITLPKKPIGNKRANCKYEEYKPCGKGIVI